VTLIVGVGVGVTHPQGFVQVGEGFGGLGDFVGVGVLDG
jgi:hypothetical protein